MTNALKSRVWLLLDCKSNIALDLVRYLFTLPRKDNGIAILHSFFYVNLKSLGLLFQTMAPAYMTLLFEGFALALAFRALLLHLHPHHAHIYILHNGSSSLALGACLEFSIFGT